MAQTEIPGSAGKPSSPLGEPATPGSVAPEARAVGGEGIEPAPERLGSEAEKPKEGVRQRTGTFLRQQKVSAARQVGAVAEALRATAENLRARDSGALASVAGNAASGLDRFAGVLRSRDIDALFDDAWRFARRRPAVVAGGAAAAGFLLARLFKGAGQGGGISRRRTDGGS